MAKNKWQVRPAFYAAFVTAVAVALFANIGLSGSPYKTNLLAQNSTPVITGPGEFQFPCSNLPLTLSWTNSGGAGYEYTIQTQSVFPGNWATAKTGITTGTSVDIITNEFGRVWVKWKVRDITSNLTSNWSYFNLGKDTVQPAAPLVTEADCTAGGASYIGGVCIWGEDLCQAGTTQSTYNYTVTHNYTADNKAYIGKTTSYVMKVSQTDPSGIAQDTVTFAVLNNNTPTTLCVPLSQSAIMTGVTFTNVTINCSPQAADIGYHSINLSATSANNQAANRQNIYTSTPLALTVKYETAQSNGTRCLGEWTECKSGNCDTSQNPPVCAAQPGTINGCGNGSCDNGETTASCPADCQPSSCGDGTCNVSAGETNGTCPADCNTGTACDGDGVCEYGESSGSCPSDCSSTTTPPTTKPDGTVSRPNNECYAGETCVSGSYCSMGSGSRYMMNGWTQECFYPDGRINCIFQQNNTNTCGPYLEPACPNGTSACNPNDTNCIPRGGTGPATGWCKNGQECYKSDGTKTCVSWGQECPAGTTICGPNDSGCIEAGKKKTIQVGDNTNNYWCKGDSEQCWKNDGTELYCVKRTQNYDCSATAASMMDTTSCPAGYGACRPGEEQCTNIGETNSHPNAWCNRGKECHVEGGLTCIKYSEECPSGSKRCRTEDKNCIEPGATFTYTKQDWPWCPDGMPVYSLTEWEGKCIEMPMGSAMANFVPKVPKGYGVCRMNERYDPIKNPNGNCLEPGQTGPSRAWCGWMPSMANPTPYTMDYSATSTRTCPALEGSSTPPPPPPPPIACDILLPPEAYVIIHGTSGSFCTLAKDGCTGEKLYFGLAECEKNLGKAGQVEASTCTQKYSELKTKVQKLLESKEDLSFRDGQMLSDISGKMDQLLGEWKELASAGSWGKIANECSAELTQRTRELEPIFKKLGSTQVGALLLKRIQDLRGRLEEAQSKLIYFGVTDSEPLEMINKMLTKLEMAQECYDVKDYECAKGVLNKLEESKERVIIKLAQYNITFTEDVLANVTKFIEERVAKVLEEKFSKFETVMTELIENKLERLAESIASLETKMSEAVVAAVTMAVENTTQYVEEAVKERFLKRVDELTASVVALEEKVAAGAVASKVREVNELILGNAWSEAFAQELQSDLAEVLTAKESGESTAELLAKLTAIAIKINDRMDEEQKALVDEGVLGFVDAPVGRWDGGLMLQAKNTCIAAGRGDDPYKLDATRNSLYQETVALTIRTAGIPLTDAPLAKPVPGLTEGAWSEPYWATLQETGYSTNFAYNAETSRGAAAKLMAALMRDKLITTSGERQTHDEAVQLVEDFKDYSQFKDDVEAIDAIALMLKTGLMQGYGETSPKYGYFGIHDPMTRNMLITVMVRASELMGIDPCSVQ